MHDHRFPRRLYRAGTEPDPRFSLANERTFLAWIRTSLALLAIGVAVIALELPIQHVLRDLVGTCFVILAMVAAVQAWISWYRTEKALRENTILGGTATGVVIVAGSLVAMALIAAGLLL